MTFYLVFILLGFPVAAALHVRWLMKERHCLALSAPPESENATVTISMYGSVLLETETDFCLFDSATMPTMAEFTRKIRELGWSAEDCTVPNWKLFYP